MEKQRYIVINGQVAEEISPCPRLNQEWGIVRFLSKKELIELHSDVACASPNTGRMKDK